jgi:hypothetical protein
VRAIVAAADRTKRSRAAVRLIARWAPAVFALPLAVAFAGYWRGWTAATALLTLGLAVSLVTIAFLVMRRSGETTDGLAAAVDRDASLDGELRSAHWFETRPDRDDWTDYHVTHAVQRARGVDWVGLYPPVRATRSWVGASALVVLTVAVALIGAGERRAAVLSASAREAGEAALASDALREKLEALLAAIAEGKANPADQLATLEQIKEMLAKVDPKLQKQLEALLKDKDLGKDAATKRKDLDAEELAERAERGENSQAGLPEDVRWALEDLAARLANSSEDRKTNPRNQAASSETGEKGLGSDQAKEMQAATAEASMQMVREAAADPGAAKMMMGGAMMGGDSRPGQGGNQGAQKGAADALLVAQALKKELVEAQTDTTGENVTKEDIRRKTEQGKSSLGFTRVAAAAAEPTRADAPPQVPESRRPLLQRYFVRKK